MALTKQQKDFLKSLKPWQAAMAAGSGPNFTWNWMRYRQAPPGGNTSGDYTTIPVGNFKVVMYRITMMRFASWSFNGVYEKHKRITAGPYTTIYEDNASLNYLVDFFKKLQANPPATAEDINAALERMVKEYKDKDIGKEAANTPIKRY